MTLPNGQISLNDVNVEILRPATQQLGINDADVRTVAGAGFLTSGTVISMNDLRGKSFSSRTSISLVISSNTNNYDVYTNRGPTYVPGTSDITVTINPGVTVGSGSSTQNSFIVPSQFSPTDTVLIINQGTISGAGGPGGFGGTSGKFGSNGGTAIGVSRAVSINNQNTIAGGGGGGAGGPTVFIPRSPKQGGPITFAGGGGGGGAGTSVGIGGAGYSSGQNGTSTTGGAGGPGGPTPPGAFTGAGGAGGGLGSAGQGTPQGSPGGAGLYIFGNPFVTWINNGTRQGGVG